MNSRVPDQDNIQERLKTVQEECRRLREENAHLRAMLGINQSPPNEPAPGAAQAANVPPSSKSGVSTPEEKISLALRWSLSAHFHFEGWDGHEAKEETG